MHETAAANEAGHLLDVDASFLQFIEDDFGAEGLLVGNAVVFGHFFCGVFDVLLEDLLFAFKHRDFRRGGTGVNRQYFVCHNVMFLLFMPS